MGLDTDKHWIRDAAGICAAMGVNKVVLSPGSRCAPLVIAFNRHPGIECISIVDERSAAFFALGMAQQLQKPVALVCTSGTAALNYSPAIAEAYYQKVPLVVFTADRPPELIDQNDGQTIRQFEVYRNFIKKSFQLPVEVTDAETLQLSNDTVVEAINTSMFPDKGPVHINVPLREPLYGMREYPAASKGHGEFIEPSRVGLRSPFDKLRVTQHANDSIHTSKGWRGAGDEVFGDLLKTWQNSRRKMILAGGYPPSADPNKAIDTLSKDDSVTVIAEITANLDGECFFHTPDAFLAALPGNPALKESDLVPDLLITFGGGIVSKKLKTLLRKYPINEHWHIDAAGAPIDTYQHLTKAIAMEPEVFFKFLAEGSRSTVHSPLNNYRTNWSDLQTISNKRHYLILKEQPYNDLKVYELLLNNIPKGSNLHLGNSTPIRYAGLFEPKYGSGITYNCNRGTSGIDGTVSTAAGAAKASGKLTTIITGDVAFFYDSNALWNKHLPGNLRIVIVNNGGGNIFRVLNGPSQIPELEEFFETRMDLNAEYIARTFGLPYYFCNDLAGLAKVLPKFFEAHNNKCAILEIRTPAEESALAMRKYLGIGG